MDVKCKHCGSYLNIREVVTRCTECGKKLYENDSRADMRRLLEYQIGNSKEEARQPNKTNRGID